MHASMYVCTVCMYVDRYVCMHASMYVWVCMYVCMYVCMFTFVCPCYVYDMCVRYDGCIESLLSRTVYRRRP